MARPYLHGTNGAVKTLAADTTLSMADSGKIFVCSQAAEINITLPAVGDAKGWVGTFVLGTSGSNHVHIVGGTAAVMQGVEVADTVTAITDMDKITFIASQAVVGERIDIFCDGSSYFVTSFSDDEEHIVAAT